MTDHAKRLRELNVTSRSEYMMSVIEDAADALEAQAAEIERLKQAVIDEHAMFQANLGNAIQAERERLREPTEAMVAAAFEAGKGKAVDTPELANALFRDHLWPAAIDAALDD